MRPRLCLASSWEAVNQWLAELIDANLVIIVLVLIILNEAVFFALLLLIALLVLQGNNESKPRMAMIQLELKSQIMQVFIIKK